MPEDRMSRIERENAETLHFIETPIRILMNAIKVVFMAVVLVVLLLVNHVGWIADLGPRSQRARDARQNRLEAQLDPSPGGQWSVFDVDFRTQPDPTNHLDRENRFWDGNRPLYEIAAMMTAVLRATLADMNLDRPCCTSQAVRIGSPRASHLTLATAMRIAQTETSVTSSEGRGLTEPPFWASTSSMRSRYASAACSQRDHADIDISAPKIRQRYQVGHHC